MTVPTVPWCPLCQQMHAGPCDIDVAKAMVDFGGAFVSALGELFFRADSDNRARIKQAWPEYWEKYAEVATAMANREKE